MPYVITTQPAERLVWQGVRSSVVTVPPARRRAIATLDDARAAMRQAVREAHWPTDIGGSNARQSVEGQISDLMASGGNAIRLPDGTRLEVAPVTYRELARRADVPHTDNGLTTAYIDAYNAVQS